MILSSLKFEIVIQKLGILLFEWHVTTDIILQNGLVGDNWGPTGTEIDLQDSNGIVMSHQTFSLLAVSSFSSMGCVCACVCRSARSSSHTYKSTGLEGWEENSEKVKLNILPKVFKATENLRG